MILNVSGVLLHEGNGDPARSPRHPGRRSRLRPAALILRIYTIKIGTQITQSRYINMTVHRNIQQLSLNEIK